MRACTHRIETPGILPILQCTHPRVHAPQQIVWHAVCEGCRFCDDGRRSDEPRVQLPDPLKPQRRGVCRQLGAHVGLRECEGCAGHVRVKVYGCSHPAHVQTTLAECRDCADFVPLEAFAGACGPRRRLGLRYDYGLGDAVQFAIVLQHLAHYYPDWQVDVVATNAHWSLFRGLCAATWNSHDVQPDRGQYERFATVPMLEVEGCYHDAPSTKIVRNLREVFRLEPIESLCRYKIFPNPEDHARAETYLRALCSPLPAAGEASGVRRFPVVLIHYQGFTHRAAKNIDEQTVGELCRAVRAGGWLPLILDLHAESQLVGRGEVLGIRGDDVTLWHPHGIQGAVITALIQRVALFVGIDSGPGHCAGATDTPSLIYWGKPLHPLHYYDVADNVTHLVRAQHADDVHPVNRDAGLAYFDSRYRYRMYRRAENMLPALALEMLAPLAPCGRGVGGEGLTWNLDWRVRAAPDHFRWDTHVVRTCTIEDEYRLGELPDLLCPPRAAGEGPGVRGPRILDVGANVGAFAAAAGLRFERPRIACVEPSPLHWPALEATAQLVRERHEADVTLVRGALVSPLPAAGEGPGVRAAVRQHYELACDAEPGNTGATRVIPSAGEGPGVRIVELAEILDELGWETAELLKLDCEGAELDLLERCDLATLARVRWIVGEYHDRERFLAAVRERLEPAGWRLELIDAAPRGIFRLHFAGPRV